MKSLLEILILFIISIAFACATSKEGKQVKSVRKYKVDRKFYIEDITFKNGIWKKNSKARTDIVEVLIGAIILDNKKFKIVPFAGIAHISINARKPSMYDFELNPDYSEQFRLDNSACVLGLTLNLKKNRPDISVPGPHGGMVKYEVYFKLKFFKFNYDYFFLIVFEFF